MSKAEASAALLDGASEASESVEPPVKIAGFFKQLSAMMALHLTLLRRNVKRYIGQTFYNLLLLSILLLISTNSENSVVPEKLDYSTLPVTAFLSGKTVTMGPCHSDGHGSALEQAVARMRDGANQLFNASFSDLHARCVSSEQGLKDYSTLHPGEVAVGVYFDSLDLDRSSKQAVEYSMFFNSSILGGVPKQQLATPLSDRFTNFFWLTPLAVQQQVELLVSSLRSSLPVIPLSPSLQAGPTPRFLDNAATNALGTVLPLYFVLLFMFEVAFCLASVMREKEGKLKVQLGIIGLRPSVYWVSHSLMSLLRQGLIIVLLTLALSFLTLPATGPAVIFLLCLIFQLTNTQMVFALTTLFDKVRTAQASVLLYLLLGSMGFLLQPNQALGAQLLVMLSAPAAAFSAISTINQAQASKTGINFSNMGDATLSPTGTPFSAALTMLFVDFVLYGLLAIYLDNVIPSQFGATLKPWYCFTKDYWSPPDTSVGAAAGKDDLDDLDPEFFEAPEDGLATRLSVRIRKLVKTFTGTPIVRAVRGLSLNMYEGQIYALLGHNGAGKSTTISLLTGLLDVTSGSASIYGLDITTNMAAIRQQLGVCPQADIYYKKLTVREHLLLIGRLKGYSSSATMRMATELVNELELADKMNSFADALSGGQKRKMCLAMAFMGNPRLVFLDEPTASMDPNSRRLVWDLLARKKAGRTIVLTTHFMDEADLLGDRIGIMAAGKLQVEGSSLFLKGRFGIGYHLDIAEKDGCHVPDVTDVIKKRVPTGRFLSQGKGELHYVLPLTESNRFAELFEELEERADELTIGKCVLSVTTLEEVFLNLAALAEEDEDGNTTVSAPHGRAASLQLSALGSDEEGESEGKKEEAAGAREEEREAILAADEEAGRLLPPVYDRQPPSLWLSMSLVWWKRMRYMLRDRASWTSQLLPPLFTLLLARLLDSVQTSPVVDMPIDLAATGAAVPTSVLFGDAYNNDTFAALRAAAPTKSVNADAVMGPASNESIFAARDMLASPNAFLGSILPTQPTPFASLPYTIMYNSNFTRSPSALMSLVNTAVMALQTQTPQDSVAFLPRLRTLPVLQNESASTVVSAILLAFYIVLGLNSIVRVWVSAPVRDREQGVKQQMLVNGVVPHAYWLGGWLWDMTNFSIVYVALVIIITSLNLPLLSEGNHLSAVLLLIFTWGMAMTAFMAMISFLWDKAATAQSASQVVAQGSFFIGTGVGVALIFIGPKTEAFLWLFSCLMPSIALAQGIGRIVLRPALVGKLECFVKKCNLNAWSMDAAGYPIIIMLSQCVLFLGITLLLEQALGVSRRQGSAHVPDAKQPEDDDVVAERERIAAGSADGDGIVMERLQRIYPARGGKDKKGLPALAKVAVADVSLAVRRGEVLGLLGPNGAGKTTAVGVLTGMQKATNGRATVAGLPMPDKRTEAYRSMGLCAQHDALIDRMTARENLQLYARLRGVPLSALDAAVDHWIAVVDIGKHADKRVMDLSGGNKRRLSVAVALVGQPNIVFLDEPSSGIDPVGRRQLWRVMQSYAADERALLLTTHLMEEADALCDRISIMINGRLVCLGSSLHLKAKFGVGMLVEVQCSRPDIVEDMTSFLKDLAPETELAEWHGGHMKFEVPSADLTLAQLFRAMEDNRSRLSIEQYVVSQTTLEQVFIRFARDQVSEDDSSLPRIAASVPAAAVPAEK